MYKLKEKWLKIVFNINEIWIVNMANKYANIFRVGNNLIMQKMIMRCHFSLSIWKLFLKLTIFRVFLSVWKWALKNTVCGHMIGIYEKCLKSVCIKSYSVYALRNGL